MQEYAAAEMRPAMLLSDLLSNFPFPVETHLFSERSFETLSIVPSSCPTKYCTFVDSEKYLPFLDEHTQMLITTESIAQITRGGSWGLCVTEQPRLLFYLLHNALCKSNSFAYQRPLVPTAVGDDCRISPLASIATENVIIGNNVIIEEFVVVRKNTVINDGTVLRSGAKIGGVGFEFKSDEKSHLFAITHAGGVIIGKNSEIQYNTCVDKAIFPWDDTVIGDDCKIDNLVHVAHSVKLEKNVMVVALSGLGGRVKVGIDSWIGFHSVVRNGLTVGQNARANMGAVVTQDIEPGQAVSGNYAIPHDRFIEEMRSRK
ncbi:MAG: UDP-3-O-(3-hydroxymyristoyl)glucosamine N-acyltransferase [Peptococcaceae bacterium]|nr:UDP-3-O-(3-hydroxymyristoyl)glucosamine N-acyltransferase [Peptococcaceae bacterium]